MFATAATIRSSAYRRAIAVHAPQVDVLEIAAPALVPLVERGFAATGEARAAVRELCAALPPDVEAIVYGCTHYPLLDAHFAEALPRSVVRIDPAAAQAVAAAALVRARRFSAGTGATQYITNGDLTAFTQNVRSWTGDLTGTINAVEPVPS